MADVGKDPLAPALSELDTPTSYPRLVHYYASGADSGRRSFMATAAAFGVDESTIRAQARAGRWAERCATADRMAVERELQAGMLVQRKAAVAQVALAERLTRIIERAVDELESRDDADALGALEPALEASKLLSKAQSALRIATGQPQSVTRAEVAIGVFGAGKAEAADYASLSDEELYVAHAASALEGLVKGVRREDLHPPERQALQRLCRLLEADGGAS